MESIFFVKKLFKLYFTFYAETFQVFPPRLSELYFLGPEELSMRKRFLKYMFFFHFRKLGETSAEIWCENSEKVVRTALYVPGETYQERNFLWKKILIHFWRPGWSFLGLLRKFFDMIFKSELQVPKRNFFEKLSYGRKFKHLHSQT